MTDTTVPTTAPTPAGDDGALVLALAGTEAGLSWEAECAKTAAWCFGTVAGLFAAAIATAVLVTGIKAIAVGMILPGLAGLICVYAVYDFRMERRASASAAAPQLASWRARSHADETDAEHHASFFVHGSVAGGRIILELMRGALTGPAEDRQLRLTVEARHSFSHDAPTSKVADCKSTLEAQARALELEAFADWGRRQDEQQTAEARKTAAEQTRARHHADAVSTAKAVFGDRFAIVEQEAA